MRESDFLSDSALQEATYGAIGMTPEEAAAELNDLPVDFENIPDFSEKQLFTWVSPERVYNPRRSATYKRNMGLLLLLIVLLLFFLSRMGLLAVVLSLIFLGFVLSNVPPRRIRHIITNYGLYTSNHFYPWLERGQRYWYETSHGQEQLIFEIRRFPYRVVLLVGHERNKKQLDKIFSHYFVLQKPEPNDVDKLITWWQKTFPME